jgi:hypothetical protein
LTVADENALRSFERRMLRKMFVPVWNGGEWRVSYNVELNEFIEGHAIVRCMKALLSICMI